MQSGSRKLLRIPSAEGDRDRFFDLSTDPEERIPLDGVGDEWAALSEALGSYERDLRARRAELLRGAPDDLSEPIPFDPQREEQLRSLGYVD